MNKPVRFVQHIRLICLILFLHLFLYTCTTYVVLEKDEHNREVRTSFIKSYSKSKSRTEQITSLRNHDYYTCLWHCRIYLNMFGNEKAQDVIHRALFSSLLRHRIDDPSLEATYDNNLYIIETIEILEQHSTQISKEIQQKLLTILQQGARQPEQFRLFIALLRQSIDRKLVRRNLTYNGLNFRELNMRFPRWYRGYNIESIESWDFKELLGIK